MPFDLTRLAMIGLGSEGTLPKPDGIHLRWGFGEGMSFPRKGFSLYRRQAERGKEQCVDFREMEPGRRVRGELMVGPVRLLFEELATIAPTGDPGLPRGLEIRRVEGMQVELPVAARAVRVTVSGRKGRVRVQAFGGGRLLAEERAAPVTGVVELRLRAPGIETLRLDGEEFQLLRICFTPMDERVPDDPRRAGWELIAEIALPGSFAEGEARVFDRQQELEKAYDQWLEEAIRRLTDPSDPIPPPARTFLFHEDEPLPVAPGTDPGDRVVNEVNILSLLLLGSLEPEFARFVGLGFVDRGTPPGTRFDYLLIGHWDLEEYYTFAHDLAREPAGPLAAPTGLSASPFPTAVSEPGQTGASVGLVWDVPLIQPAVPVGYHPVWFDLRGVLAAPPDAPAPPPSVTFPSGTLNKDGRIVIGRTLDPAGNPVYPDHFFLHLHAADGWWLYGVRGYDLFGRESPWGPDEPALVQDRVPPPAPRLLETVQGGQAVHVPLQARYLERDDPQLAAADRVFLDGHGTDAATVVEWTWFAAQQALAPDTREFRIYAHPSFRSAGVQVISVGPPAAQTVTVTLAAAPGFDVTGGVLSVRGISFAVAAASGASLTVLRAPSPRADGTIELLVPTVGPGSVVEALSNPRRWQERLHVEPLDAAQPARTYRVVLPGPRLHPTAANPVATGWIGVTAVDDKDYVSDDPARTGPLAGRPGNESEIAVRARITAVHRAAPPPGPVPSGPAFATRADFHGRSRYALDWPAASPASFHVWRATEAAVTASDLRARQERPAGSYYSAHGPFDDDPGLSQWLAAEFPALSQSDLLASPLSPAAREAWKAWGRRFYDPDRLSDDLLRELADRVPNERAFTQLTPRPVAGGPFHDEFDGRVQTRYLYRTQAVHPNGLTGPLSPTAQPVRLHDVLPPRRPVFTGAVVTDRGATLTWAANTERDMDRYELFRAPADQELDPGDPRGMVLRASLPAAQLSFADGGLAPGKDYRYLLVAVDRSGNRSEPALPRQVRAVALAPPPVPVLTANRTPDGQSVLLDWTPPEEGTRGLVERAENGGPFRPLSGWLPVDQSDAVDTAPPSGGGRYRLRLMDAAGNITDPSQEVTA